MPPQRGSSGSTSITELPSPRAGDSNVKPLLIPGADSAYVPSSVPKYVVPQPGESYEGLLGDLPAEWRGKPLWSQLNWLHTPLLLFTPLVAAYGVWHWAFDWRTLLFAVAYYFFSGLGITAGYHRHFAHRAYSATYAMKVLLMLMGTAAVEGSIKWWARGHRAHHKYVDTPKDPYAVVKGFWYAHIGWMLKRDPKDPKRDGKQGYADISDLVDPKTEEGKLNAPIVNFQNKFYLPLAILMSFVVPTVIAGWGWGDWWGGYFVAGVARLVFVHHSTFCVNSLAHWVGDATYTDGHTARNSIVTAVVTLGEGYHNFHHEFPNDYRNGVEWWQYDPTKIFIYCASLLGLAYDLRVFPQEVIVKGQLQMKQKALDAKMGKLSWGPNPASLQVLSKRQFEEHVAEGKRWVTLDGFVLDVSLFAKDHPGGEGLLQDKVGQDVSQLFKGQAYKHSNAAHNVAHTLRVARIEGHWAR